MSVGVEVRLLGELEVRRGGHPVPLPASKKSRALLGYLAATGRPHLRQHLCELLWEGPDDPRAALRWSLAKLRPQVDGDRPRLLAERDRVAFDPAGAQVDLLAVRAALEGGLAAAETDTLREAAARFRGELLEGLDLPDCYRYHEWVVAERESVRAVRLAVLQALAERLADDQPEEALRHARGRVAIDPLAEAGHVAVVRLLGRLGRSRDALQQYEQCRRLLEAELGTRPSPDLEAARRAVTTTATPAPAPPPSMPAAAPAAAAGPTLLVGRAAERERLQAMVDAAASGTSGPALLLVGEPGIGKSRLLDELGALVRAAGGRVLPGRAFEAEMVRPYGGWIDALRSVGPAALGDAVEPLRADLAPLLPEMGAADANPADRNRLFDAVRQLLLRLAGTRPLALVLDDVHWCDETSAALLHYVVRGVRGTRVLVACGARPGELADNPVVLRTVRALGREGRLATHTLEPLAPSEIEALARSVHPGVDAGRVVAESEGNALFALELARALGSGRSGPSETLAGLIDERLARVEERARDLLPWAAALGRSFALETLGAVSGIAPADLLPRVQELELRGIIREAHGGGYDFVHDLVRRSAYQQLSEPRRRLVHRSVARALSALPDPDGSLAGDVAHHASLGGDPERAARASVAAGDRCLRVFAYTEAAELAERGLREVAGLPREARLQLHMALLGIFIHAGAARDRVREIEGELSRIALEAQEAGLFQVVQTGFYLTSFLHYYGGQHALAHEATLRAAEAGRSADPATTARAVANTGRCLWALQRDLPRATALLSEAAGRASEAGLEILDVHWGTGLACHYAGEHAQARAELERAIRIARREGEHWSECDCLSHLVLMALEEGRPGEAREACAALLAVAAKMGEGSEAPFAEALLAVSRLALDEPGAGIVVDAAVARLREIDSRWMVACISNLSAEVALAAGRSDEAGRRAADALAAASAVGRRTETAHAHALLGRLALARGDEAEARAHLDAVRPDLAVPGGLSHRAATAVRRLAAGLGVPVSPVPTPTPTLVPTPLA